MNKKFILNQPEKNSFMHPKQTLFESVVQSLPIQHIILDFSSINLLDSMGANAIVQVINFITKLKKKRVNLYC